MTTYRKGDLGTLGATVLHDGPSADGLLHIQTVGPWGIRGFVTAEAFTLTERATPEEPQVKTCVTAKDGLTWKRFGLDSNSNWCLLVDGTTLPWRELLRRHGPVTILVPGETLGYDR